MSEQRKIRECPCCPDGKGRIYRHGIKLSELFYVGCLKCGLRTADYTTSAEAIAAWNQRAGEAELAALREQQTMPSQGAQLTAALGECALLTEACQEKEAELVTVRADRDEAIGAALKVEQLNYDQAQEIAGLRNDNAILEVRLHQLMDISADRGRTITAYERELLPLRELREACQRYGQAMVDDRAKDGYHSGGDIQDAEDELWQALAACDEASAPTGDEHK